MNDTMDLFTYIKTHINLINYAIAKQLGATSELIAYLKYTPWNINLAIVKQMIDNGESGGNSMVGTAIVGTAAVGE